MNSIILLGSALWQFFYGAVVFHGGFNNLVFSIYVPAYFNSYYQYGAFDLTQYQKVNDMDKFFPIKINDKTLMVKKLKFKNYYGAFEIWKEDNLQFILVHNISRSENHAWNVGNDESSKVDREYIDKILTAIDSHYP